MGFCFVLSDASTGGGVRRIAIEQIVKAVRSAGDTDRDPGLRIHDVRRRCKRLQALLRLVRPGFRDFAQENARIRDAAAGLSSARDRKVLVDTLNDLNAWAHQTERFMLEAIAPDVDRIAYDNAALAQFRAAMESLRPSVENWAFRGDGFSLLAGD